jgi:serine/threonine protein kinase/Tfp pilus assembly protein PilF
MVPMNAMKNSSHVVGATLPSVGAVLAKKYTIQSHLGDGDSGHVFIAEQTTLRKRVALKLIDQERSIDQTFAGRVLREARVLSLLRHDNIARLIDYGTTAEGQIYLISELLDGEDLRALRRRVHRMPWRRARELALQIVRGLRAAHDKGVVHGGLRPSNCFMVRHPDGADHLKLLSFGLSPADRITPDSPDSLLDVAFFMSPEQAQGSPIDARADIYSLGVILYTLMIGGVPFSGARPHQVATLHKMAAPAPLHNIAADAEIPPAVEELVLRLLAKRPADRFADAAALEQAITEINAEGEVARRVKVTAALRGPLSQVGDQPTRDSALFYSIEALQAMLAGASDPREQLSVLDKMERALATMAGPATDTPDAERWRQWIRQARDYAWFQIGESNLANERWRELVEVYERRLQLAVDDDARVTLRSALGNVYLASLLNYERAIESFRAVLELAPDDLEAHLGLSRALERIGEHDDAITFLERFIELCTDPARSAVELAHLGGLLHNKLSDTDQAIVRLFQATELDPANLPALSLLAEIFRARHEWLELAQVLEQIVEHTASNYERIERATEAGFIWLEKLQIKERAVAMLARVVELDPENTRVGTVLGKIYYDAKNYLAAAPIFDALVRKLDALDLRPSSQVGILVRAATIARSLGNLPRAAKHFKRALELDPDSVLALQGAGDVAMAREAWDEAKRAYERLLSKREGEARAAIYVKLAEIDRAEGSPDLGLGNLKKALEVDPKSRPALDAALAAHTERKDWPAALKARQAILGHLKGDERADMFREIGDLFRHRLGEPGRAIAAYQRAHELRPKDLTLLHTLLELHTAAKRWTEVMPILDQLVVLEGDAARRAKYHYTAAVLLRDELGDPSAALERFDLVLRDDPSALKAFQAIDTLITQKRDWKALERAYRKMINRLPADDTSPLKCLLWQNLAEIYRTRLGDFRSAVRALDVAISLDPAGMQRHLIRCELLESLAREDWAGFGDRLIQEHNALIRLDPSHYPSYHRLFQMYRDGGLLDNAYCVARALVFLKQADADEQALCGRYPAAAYRRARGRVTDDLIRRCILPGDQAPLVTNMLAYLMPALISWRSKPRPPSLRGAELIDTGESPSPAAQALVQVCALLGVNQPELYFQPGEAGDALLISARGGGGEPRPVLIAQAGLLREREDAEITFEVARAVFELYAPLYAFLALERSPENLKQILVACSLLADRGGDIPQGIAPVVAELQGRTTPAALEQVKQLARQLDATDVKIWARGAAVACYRFAFILANDLGAAAHAIAGEQRAGNLLGKDALKELIIYSVSEAYFELRRALGLAVA